MNKTLIYSFVCIIAINDGKIKADQVDNMPIDQKQQIETLKTSLAQNKMNDAHNALKSLITSLNAKIDATLKGNNGFYSYLKKSPTDQKQIRDAIERALHETYELIDAVRGTIEPTLEKAQRNSGLLAKMMDADKAQESGVGEMLSKKIPESNPVITVFDSLQLTTLIKLYYEEFMAIADQFTRSVMRASIDFVTLGGYKS